MRYLVPAALHPEQADCRRAYTSSRKGVEKSSEETVYPYKYGHQESRNKTATSCLITPQRNLTLMNTELAISISVPHSSIYFEITYIKTSRSEQRPPISLIQISQMLTFYRIYMDGNSFLFSLFPHQCVCMCVCTCVGNTLFIIVVL